MDQVLDAASETSSNGSSSPFSRQQISIDGKAPSVSVSASSPVHHHSVVVEGQRQTTFLHQEDPAARTNGHVHGEESGRGAAKFELRAFQEERRPAKLFSPGEEQQVRVTRRRPTEEVHGCETTFDTVTLCSRVDSYRSLTSLLLSRFVPTVRFRSWSVSVRS